jgi:hypothetical protein
MKYTVAWLPLAERLLAQIWTQAEKSERSSITSAANKIDEWLQTHGDEAGESRADGHRLLLSPPLGVIFKVYPKYNTVKVFKVWHFRKSRKK